MQKLLLLLVLALLLPAAAAPDKPLPQKRLVKLESSLYGWYAVISPDIDRTVGTRKLYKISGADQFLKGLAGRLVLLEGEFTEGTLSLPALAAPPQTLPDGSYRQAMILEAPFSAPVVTTPAGYRFQDPDELLRDLTPGKWRIDGIWSPSDAGSPPTLIGVLGQTPLEAPAVTDTRQPNLDQPALLDLTITQDLLNRLTAIGLSQNAVSAQYHGLTLALNELQLRLDQGDQPTAQPWSLLGSMQLLFGSKDLLETSFEVSALPLVTDDVLRLKPDWTGLKLEGQLPFSFVLSSGSLEQLLSYLPETVPVIPLGMVTSRLQKEALIPADLEAHWYLGTPTPGAARLALDTLKKPLPQTSPVAPGAFRLVLDKEVVDRMVKRQVSRMLSPDTPFRPEPPIEVGKALFVPIRVKEIYVRKLEAGYDQGVFKFQDLVIDVGWEAGPFSGLEPLLQATGYLRPHLAGPSNDRYWSWDLVLTQLEVRSDKIPGDKKDLAREFKPKIEGELGDKLARKQHVSNRMPLNKIWPTIGGSLVLTELKPLDRSLILEGRLE